MAEYEARRDDDKEAKKAEANEANKEAIKVSTSAMEEMGGVPGAIGKGFGIARKISGGKSDDLAAGITTQANKAAPFVQDLTNSLAKSKLANKAYDAYKMKEGKGAEAAADKVGDGAEKAKEGVEKAKEGADKAKEAGAKGKDLGNQMKKGGEDKDSLPSSDGKNSNPTQERKGGGVSSSERRSSEDVEEETAIAPTNEKKESKTSGIFAATGLLPVAIAISPIFLVLIIFMPFVASLTDSADYEDLFGISEVAGLNTGGVEVNIEGSQKAFYDRIMEVKADFAEKEEYKDPVDPVLIVSVFHAVNTYGAEVTYNDMTKIRIESIAAAMFDEDGKYSQITFKENLKEYIINEFLPQADYEKKEAVVAEVFNYIERYKTIIGEKGSYSDSASSWKQYDGEWATTEVGNSGNTIKQIGCLVTSIAIQISRSGVQTNIANFNPGTFVEALNKINAFSDGGALLDYSSVTKVVPDFKYQGYADVRGMDRDTKLNKIKEIVNEKGVYAVAEVKGDTGQHWVAIESVNGDTINMIDPGSNNTDMWGTYGWENTSRIVYYKVD